MGNVGRRVVAEIHCSWVGAIGFVEWIHSSGEMGGEY